MQIALDFDGTVTRDPGFFAAFIRLVGEYGYDVRIVTFRNSRDKYDIEEFLREAGLDIPVVTTGGVSKRKYCLGVDFFPNIWIDDSPEFIVAFEGLGMLPEHLIRKAMDEA